MLVNFLRLVHASYGHIFIKIRHAMDNIFAT